MTHPDGFSRLCAKFLIGLTALLITASPVAGHDTGPTPATTIDATQDVAAVSPVERLMRFFSRADGERCPMYPTCSHYARQAFAEKGVLLGWVLTCDRLLRCGRDETRLAPPINVQGVRHTYDPLSANIFWWDNR